MGFELMVLFHDFPKPIYKLNSFMTYKKYRCTVDPETLRNIISKIYNLLGPIPLAKVFLAAAVVAFDPLSLEDIVESAKCQDVESRPAEKTADNVFWGYQHRFPFNTETQTQVINRLKDSYDPRLK